MFTGEFESALDNKNRLTIPSRLREAAVEKTEGRGFWLNQG
ncbi:MAG: hypothetical protein V2A79_09625, partial [Planctomycetota bacterium]